MSDFSGFDLASTFIIPWLQPAPGCQMGGIGEGRYIVSEFCKDGRSRPCLDSGDSLEECIFVREPLAAKGIHLGLALILVLLRQFDFIAQLSNHLTIDFGYHTCQRPENDLSSHTVNGPAMNGFNQLFWVCNPLRKLFDHTFVTFAICIGNIVADADVAALKCSIKFGQFIDDILIQIEYAPVILAELLDTVLWNVTTLDQILVKAGRYPFCILYIALFAGKLFDEEWIDQLQIEVRLQYTPYGHPIDAGTFHTDV